MYVSEELVALSLFDEVVQAETRRGIVHRNENVYRTVIPLYFKFDSWASDVRGFKPIVKWLLTISRISQSERCLQKPLLREKHLAKSIE